MSDPTAGRRRASGAGVTADLGDVDGPAEGVEAGGVLTERSSRVQAAHRLLRRSRRTQAGEFLAEGAQAVREAVAAERETPGTVRELYVTADAGTRHVTIVRAAFAVGVPVTQVTDRAAAALSDSVQPQGIVARCALPDRSLDELLRTADGGADGGSLRLVAVLVQTNDPGNAGAVIRLADAAGADAVLFAGDAVDPFNPKAVRASAGSIFHLPVAAAGDPVDAVRRLSDAGLSVLATTGAAGLDLPTAEADGILDLPTAWLFGSEAHGLPDDVVAAADESVRVPIYGRAESLNLATAAALFLYASARAHRPGAGASGDPGPETVAGG
ncbi:TrmH family RNA methyltransferase [Nakamurella leprariae]|uniref:RNA methyltransferase n=1 Tax=Nakamurella leprariae TaxID=2803911 RepID=A0A939BZ42_9ACTN|nr:RNA methyltransferase [Nakamurella leprariae]MBM9467755.1 RNA methyltransferase [Nakamurella leprariae]